MKRVVIQGKVDPNICPKCGKEIDPNGRSMNLPVWDGEELAGVIELCAECSNKVIQWIMNKEELHVK